MKKILYVILSFCISIGFLQPTFATNDREEYNSVILSGSGTYEDPYVLADCELKDYLDYTAKEAVQPSYSLALDFSGNLTGEYRYSQITGGVWTYSSGGMSVNNAGALRINKISYSTYAQNILNIQAYENINWRTNIQQGIGTGLAGTGLTQTLIAAGMGSIMAGAIGSIFYFALPYLPYASSDYSVMKQARDTNHGILAISYSTSYQGSWYVSNCLDVWWGYTVSPNPPHVMYTATVQLPNSYYGVGNYVPK